MIPDADTTQLSTIEEHKLYKQYLLCVDMIKKVKSDLYPKNANTKKYYSEKLPVKTEINELKSSIKGLEKAVISLLKQRNEIAKVPKNNNSNSLLRLKPEMAAFIGTNKKGLGDVYKNTLLTQWFTNYFYVNNMARGIYIIPNEQIITLFKSTLVELGVVDARGKLLDHKDENGKVVRGFKFIKLQNLFGKHVIMNEETGKRHTFKCDDAKILDILKREHEFMKRIKDERHNVDTHKKVLDNLDRDKLKAKQYGDDEQAADKENHHMILLKKAEKQLKLVCREADFPVK